MTTHHSSKDPSMQQIKDFLKFIAEDAVCKDKVSNVKNLEELASVADSYGYKLDIELIRSDSDFVKSVMNRELEDHELEAIAGGGCVDPDIRTNTCMVSLFTDGGVAWNCTK